MARTKTRSELNRESIEVEELGAVTADEGFGFFQPPRALVIGADSVPAPWVAVPKKLVRLESSGQEGVGPAAPGHLEEIARRHVV